MTFDDSSAMRHHDDADHGGGGDHHHDGGGRGGGCIEIGADDSNRFQGSSSDRNHYDWKRQKLIHHLNVNSSGSTSTSALASAAAPAPSASAPVPACLSSSNRTVSSANNSTAEGEEGCDDDNASASTEAHDDDEEECSGGSDGEEGRKVNKDQDQAMGKESAEASVVQPDEEGKSGNDDVKRDGGSEGGGKDVAGGGDDDDDDVSQEERDTEFVDSFMRHSASVRGAVGAPGPEYSRAASAASASPALLEETSVETAVTGGGVPTTVASSQQKGEGGGEVTASSAASTSATATSSSAATTTDDGEDGDGLTSMFPYRRKHSSSLSLQEFSWAPPQPQQNFVFTVQPTRPSPTSQQQVDSPNVSLSAASGAAAETLIGTASTAAASKPSEGASANDSTNAPSNDGTGSNNATWRDETEMFLDSPSPAALWTTGAMREANDYEATCDDFAFLDDLGFASSTGDGYAMGEGDPSQPQHSFFYSSSGSTNNHLPLMLPEEQPTPSSAVAVAAAVAAAAGSSSSNLQAGSRNASKIGTVLSAEATEKILDGLNPGPSKSDATTRQKRRRSSKSASPKSPRKTKAASTNTSGSSITVPDLNGGKSGAKPKKSSKSTGGATPRTSNRSLPAHVVDYLKAWLHDPQHVTHPFPTDLEKQQMLIDTGLDLKRLNNWFVNYRYRHWKPQMEAEGKLMVNKHGGGNSSGPTKSSENSSNGKSGNVRRASATSVDSSVATAPSISSAPTALAMKVTPQFATSSNPVKLPTNGPPPQPSLLPGATGFATPSGALGLAAAAAAAMTNSPSKGTSSTTTISAKTKAQEVDIGLPQISSKTTSFGVPNPIFGANAQTSSTGDSST
mmetsp:Transcript_26201/g.62261  ORF Transcript_26201/g.62261 Transcript_26201/m.62261 type:complete len:850 (+) Transcript_26201:311-2860(+)